MDLKSVLAHAMYVADVATDAWELEQAHFRNAYLKKAEVVMRELVLKDLAIMSNAEVLELVEKSRQPVGIQAGPESSQSVGSTPPEPDESDTWTQDLPSTLPRRGRRGREVE